MSWNADPEVEPVYGRPIAELLAERPRRQRLDGFEPVYSDIVDYIVRCTHRIWEEKDIGLCNTHYSDDCPVFMPGGYVTGREAVTRNTTMALSSFPDRNPIAEEVIWSEDAPGVFLSSHRISSYATHLGEDTVFGAPSGRRAGVRIIADCLCRENLIIDEWLVRDNLQLARNLGLDPLALARRQAAADREGDPARFRWLADERARVRETAPIVPPDDHPAVIPNRALALAFNDGLFGEASQLLSPSVECQWASGRHAFGRGGWIAMLSQLRGVLPDAVWRLDHYAARALPDGDVAVALRWALVGVHACVGVWGAPTGRELMVLGISHYRLRGSRIVEDVTLFDELALLRQVEGGLGA